MPSFNELVTRTGVASLIPPQYSTQIIQDAVEESAVLRMATRLPDMTSKMLNMPVLSSLPMAYFVNGDTGLKQTTKLEWDNKIITAEEIAVIVPVPDAVLADADYDLWTMIQPLVRQAFGQVVDGAILNSTNKPASWPNGIITDATTKGNVITATADAYKDIMEAEGLISKVEENGFLVNGFLGNVKARSYLRGARGEDGHPIFRTGMTDGTTYQLDGQRIEFPRNGSMPVSGPLLIAGDWSKLVYAIRQDMTVTKTNQAVITDADGKVILNLYQQDMTALRFVMRLGWQLPNPANAMGIAEPYPFAVLNPAGA